MNQKHHVLAIASPLEAEFVERIRREAGHQIEIRYQPDLLPAPRYVGDHTVPTGWQLNTEQALRWRSMLAEADIFWDVPQHEPAAIHEACPRMRWVQTSSAGVGPLVIKLGLAEHGVIVTTASGIHAGPLAEWVFSSLLFHTKGIGQLLEWQTQHHWQRTCTEELQGKTMAIVGPGRIGRQVGSIAHAFGMTTWAMALSGGVERHKELGVDRLFARQDLHAMLAGADVLVLSCPATPETHGMIGASEFAVMKRSVVFINIARASVVDEAAMMQALSDGTIGFASLDVFHTEPLPPDSPLWDMPNVMINSHSASTVFRENERLVDRFLDNLAHYLRGNFAQMTPQFNVISGY